VTPAGPVLGLDLGASRIGVALSDPERRQAIPIGTVHVGQPPGELRAIARLVVDHAVTAIVIGLPTTLAGTEGGAAAQARAFGEALGSFVAVPIAYQDERLSTVAAERALAEAGIRGQRRRHVVDRTAAAVILQAWLDTNAER